MRARDMDAIVLAGGESSRMGAPKALLRLGDTTLLGAVLAVLQPLFRRVLVVAREVNSLEGFDAELFSDDRPEQGPLVGLARGLAVSDAPWCFVVACDMPFLRPQVIERMAGQVAQSDILAPYLDDGAQPLHAFYSRACLPIALELLDGGVTSMRALLDRCAVRTVDAGSFSDIDPNLRSFRDLDTPEDYQAARVTARES